jgi:hypothetical protein
MKRLHLQIMAILLLLVLIVLLRNKDEHLTQNKSQRRPQRRPPPRRPRTKSPPRRPRTKSPPRRPRTKSPPRRKTTNKSKSGGSSSVAGGVSSVATPNTNNKEKLDISIFFSENLENAKRIEQNKNIYDLSGISFNVISETIIINNILSNNTLSDNTLPDNTLPDVFTIKNISENKKLNSITVQLNLYYENYQTRKLDLSRVNITRINDNNKEDPNLIYQFINKSEDKSSFNLDLNLDLDLDLDYEEKATFSFSEFINNNNNKNINVSFKIIKIDSVDSTNESNTSNNASNIKDSHTYEIFPIQASNPATVFDNSSP